MSFGPPVTPPVVKNLLIALVVIFVLQQFAGRAIEIALSVVPPLVWEQGYVWQPFTYMWLHGGLAHLLLNGFMLWMFGSQMALAWGAQRFLRYYLICGVGAGLIISLWPYVPYGLGLAGRESLVSQTLGASGAIYGIVLAYSLTWPERTIMLIFPPVAFRAVWLIPIMFGMTYIMAPGGNISHLGHLGGVLVGWIYLRRQGRTGPLFSLNQLKYRWRRYRMRRQLRSVRNEEFSERKRRNNDRTIH
jgi:membrane associated rhomboid family serine protease